MLKNNLQIDLRVVEPEQYGSALMYFTGSRDHNIALRKRGQKRDLKINEYGVFNEDEERVAGETEEEIYDLLDLSYIEPELRENRGEIEAAENGNLPKLITLDDIRGDLHAHTKRTDGHYSLEEMIQAAVDRGYEYFAITDHSKSNTVANGFDKDRLQQEIEDIEKLRDQFDSIQILKGIELDILEDGSLDLPDDILEKLDVVVCSIHSKFGLSRDKQTERVIKAMDNPNFHIFGHPTGRLLQEREPYDIDMEKIMNAAKEKGCFLELNAHRDRLDLDDINCKMAKEKGVLVAISTDAHSKANLDDMKLGIGQARRGWLSPEDVLNTRSWEEVKKLLKRK
jgi:DNA polymerase (family 10)